MAVVDLRSDTVTRPTEEMRKAMYEAEVGDDVLGDDPTVQKLEETASERLGKDAAMYVPSGTMGNSIAIKTWTNPGDEVILDELAHIYNFESAHTAMVSGVQIRTLPNVDGHIRPSDVRAAIRPKNLHLPNTNLICLENTNNNASGKVMPLEVMQEIRAIADEHGLRIHLDGARIFNASIASGTPVDEIAALADSVMFCLSKGLCAPVGSMLVGPADFIERARKVRKILGGGMRQVGVLAAPGIIALTKMTERLADDHARAKKLAQAISGLPGIVLNAERIETNIIIFSLEHPKLGILELLDELHQHDVWALPRGGDDIRLVTHHDVDDVGIDHAIESFEKILAN
jgi:threonine aldolase